MKIARLIVTAGILASSTTWAGAPPPSKSINIVDTLTNTADFVDGKKIKSTKVKKDDLVGIMCPGVTLEKKDGLVALIPCPVDTLAADGLELAVFNKGTEEEVTGCIRIDVDISGAIAAIDPDDGDRITAISAIADIDIPGLLQWTANVQVSTKVQKKGTLAGLNCASNISSSAGTGLIDLEDITGPPTNPISAVKVKISKVQGGTE